jgi:hypothetical protein
MRWLATLTAVALLSSCAKDDGAAQPSASPQAAQKSSVALLDLCSGLNHLGFVGGVWKKGSTGYYCATNELPVGQAVLWMEVRGTNDSSADSLTLGADVKGGATDDAVRKRFEEASEALLNKLGVGVEQRLRMAMQADQPLEVRTGKYDVVFASDLRSGIRENRLTIRPST